MSDFLSLDDLGEDALGRVFVDTDEVLAVFRAFDELIAEPANATNGKGLAVLGPPRCGKTALVAEYLRRCTDRDVGDRPGEDVRRRPLKAARISLLPGTRLNTIPSRTLEVLGHPAPYYGNRDRQTSHVIHEITEGGYDLIVFDEIHHLMSSENARVRENGSHWLTHVLDETRCPMILVGYSAFRDILNENGFLGGRLVPAPPLAPYVFDRAESLAMFRLVLEEFERALGFQEPSRLAEADVAKRILVLCNGRIGLLENFLTHARAVARRKGYRCIRQDVLREAAEGVRQTWCALRFNPFEVDDIGAAARNLGGSYTIAGDGPNGGRRQ